MTGYYITAQIFWLKNRKPDLWRNRNREETPETEILPATVDMNDIIQQIEADGNDPEEPPS